MGDTVHLLSTVDRFAWDTGSWSGNTLSGFEIGGWGGLPEQDAVAILSANLDLRPDPDPGSGLDCSLTRTGNYVEGCGVIRTTLDVETF